MSQPGDAEFAAYQAQLNALMTSWETNGGFCIRSNVYCALNSVPCMGSNQIDKNCGLSGSTGPTGTCLVNCSYTEAEIAGLRSAWIAQIPNLDIQRRFFKLDLTSARLTPTGGVCPVGWTLTGPAAYQECTRTADNVNQALKAWDLENDYTYPICYWDYTDNPAVPQFCGCKKSLNQQLRLVLDYEQDLKEWGECNQAYLGYTQNLATWERFYNSSMTATYNKLAVEWQFTNTCAQECKCPIDVDHCFPDATCMAEFGYDWGGYDDHVCKDSECHFGQGKPSCKSGPRRIHADVTAAADKFISEFPRPIQPCIPTPKPIAAQVSVVCCGQFFNNISADNIEFYNIIQKCDSYLEANLSALNEQYTNGTTGATQSVYAASVAATGSTSSTSHSTYFWISLALIVVLVIILIVVAILASRKKNK